MVLLESLVDRSVADRRFTAWIVASIAVAAILLAVTAIYGLLAYLVAHRRRAIGVRMALGARSAQVGLGIVACSVRLSLKGAAFGAALCVPILLTIRSQLFAVSPGDVTILVGSATVLVMLTTLAGAVPAYRAARTDPAEIIRGE